VTRRAEPDVPLRELPELFDDSVKARSLAYLYVAGATLAALTVALPHPERVNETALLLLALAALVIGAIFYLRADRTREWQLHAAVALGTSLVALANHYVGPGLLYALLFSWTALYAFYFFDIRLALAHLALVGALYGVVLADQGQSVVHWVLAVGTPAVAGLAVSRLLESLRRQAAKAQARALALRESEQRTRLVLDSAPDGFLAIDEQGTVTAWNGAAERLFGWSGEEAVGRRLRDLVFTEAERPAHDERRQSLLDRPDPARIVSVEVELRRRDGSVFPAEASMSSVRTGDEIVISAFIRDLTERHRRREEREALLGEQAARAEAERIAEMLSGMQLLVDATLVHRSIGDMLSELVTRIRGVLQADAATIFLADEAQLQLSASSGGPPEEPPDPIPFGEGFAGRVALTREAMVSHDAATDLEDPSLAGLGVDSLIGIPLLAEGEVTGVLVVCAAAPRSFSGQDIGLLRLAADRVALAIDHARVYEREHRIAETLQRSLLPDRLPHLPGLAVAARYLPAASEAEVGGDWYDVMAIPGGRVAVVMGDVAGKGLEAASMVGRLRSALRAYALEGHDPATALDQLNRLAWTEEAASQMATLLYAIFDPADGVLRWVNAGHMPPLLVTEEAPRFLQGARSVPLGVLPFPGFEEVSSPVPPGGTVVLFTDGLVERAGTSIDAGLAALAGAVVGARVEPEALCDHLLRTLVPDAGAPDDVALLALRSVPMEDRFRDEFPAEPESLASMRGLLRRWLRHAGADDQQVAEIVTAAGEAATNAVEHAGAEGDTPFEITGRVAGSSVLLTVRDSGEWRAPRGEDRGRGLSLMRALMDSVEVEPGPRGTRVTLRRDLASVGSGGDQLG